MVFDELSSEGLMPPVARSNKRAFSCLVNWHRKTVYGDVYRFFKTFEEADDVLSNKQVGFIRSAIYALPAMQRMALILGQVDDYL